MHALCKHAYAILKFYTTVKQKKIQIKNCDIFLIFAQNIDCGYTLERSNEYPQSMFFSKNKK